MLICPNCHQPLIREDKRYVCLNGHSFDIAKQGYCNLLIHNKKDPGDNKTMVDARQLFFSQDYYRVLKEKIIEVIKELNLTNLIDAGCGQGYYTNAIDEALHLQIYGFDMSKLALAKASKKNRSVHYFAASVFELPVSDHSFDGLLSIFAPFSLDEIQRVLKPNGYFIKVGPGPYHLYGLKKVLYQEPYLNQIETVNHSNFELAKHCEVNDEIYIEGQEKIDALFKMTPYYYHTPRVNSLRLQELENLKTQIQFEIEVYQVK